MGFLQTASLFQQGDTPTLMLTSAHKAKTRLAPTFLNIFFSYYHYPSICQNLL